MNPRATHVPQRFVQHDDQAEIGYDAPTVGHASTLEMTAEEMRAAADRKRKHPIGFQAPRSCPARSKR